jgi:hypothetical protein
MAFTHFAKARRDPRVRHGTSQANFRKQVKIEVVKTPTWARRSPNAPVAGDLNLEIDIPAAVTARFVPT